MRVMADATPPFCEAPQLIGELYKYTSLKNDLKKKRQVQLPISYCTTKRCCCTRRVVRSRGRLELFDKITYFLNDEPPFLSQTGRNDSRVFGSVGFLIPRP